MARDKYITNVKPRLEEIKEMRLDMTEAQIAKTLGVARSTFERYKKDHPELREALKAGNTNLVKRLKSALIMKATGFTQTETKRVQRFDPNGKIVTLTEEVDKYYPPDLGAIHLLLKNLDPEWRNDDQTTVDMKRERLELEKEKTEEKIW